MRIVGLETLHSEELNDLVWVQIHTDEGLVGLEGTFRNADAVVAYIHETVAPYLIGRDPLNRALICNTHLLARAANGLIAETVRSHLEGFYREVMSDLPKVEGGFISPLDGPGLGASLNSDVLARPDLIRRASGQCVH